MAGPGIPGKAPGSPKTGGRKKGTPNKNKLEFAEKLDAAAKARGHSGLDILGEISDLYYQMRETNPEKAVDMLGKMMEYQFPKKKAVEVTGKDGGPVEVDLTPAASKFDELAGGDE